jgi:hypothetical protein
MVIMAEIGTKNTRVFSECFSVVVNPAWVDLTSDFDHFRALLVDERLDFDPFNVLSAEWRPTP